MPAIEQGISRGAPQAQPKGSGRPLFGSRQLDCRTLDYKNIPVKSDVIAGIMELDVEAENCFRELDNYICSDPGIATLVLRVVNSPFYGHGGRIANIPKAISVLGFNVVRSLAMLAFSRSMFSLSRNPQFQRHVWQHSLLTALAGQAICAEVGDANDGDETFIAGLMHDMGKVLLFKHQQRRYLDVLALVIDKGCASVEAEQRLFGCHHLDVGREAVSQWKLPQRFADFMGSDISAPRPEWRNDPVITGLAAANYLVRSNGIGAQAQPDVEERKRKLAGFGLDAARCAAWAQDGFVTDLTRNETYQLCANL